MGNNDLRYVIEEVESMDLLMMDYTRATSDKPKVGSTMHINHEYIPRRITIREDTWEEGQNSTVLTSNNENNIVRAASNDNRRLIGEPKKLIPHRWCGLVTAVYNLPDGEVITKRATGWKFSEEWVMTAAHIVFDPERKVFADSVTFQPALSGYEESSPYAPITVDRAVIHPNYRLNAGIANPENILDYSFLLLNPNYERPEGYLGFYYQYGYYSKGEAFTILSYPSDLPSDAAEDKKGTYMHSHLITHNGYDASISVVYSGIRTAGDAGAPVYWYDYSGKLCCIGILGMNAGSYNEVIKFQARDFSMMRYLKRHFPVERAYVQPPKPSTQGLATINSLLPLLKKIESRYVEYYRKTFSSTLTTKKAVTGITKFLRHNKGDDIVGWNMLEQVSADGIIGEETLEVMPELDQSSSDEKIIRILQCALCCNKYPVAITGLYNNTVMNAVRDFQLHAGLVTDPDVEAGEVNRRTWTALLQSKGDPERKANACDCAVKLDDVKAQKIKSEGYNYVGRYLSDGTDSEKGLTRDELDIITAAGLKVFAIYQESGITAAYFTKEQGETDALKAFEAAGKINVPAHEVIYFGVGYDFTEQECRTAVKQYFQGIADIAQNNGIPYAIGIYAPRNTCSIIREEGLAESIFVADKNTSYSGNLGYVLPDGWAFDQFGEETIEGDGFTFQIDKVMASGIYEGFDADTLCGHENYHDCTLHSMVMKEDGYYECQACGYRVPSPSLQDKIILSDNDYLKVIALEYAYAFMLAQEDEYGIYFHDWWDKIYKIRSKAEYTGKYGYSDGAEICLFIPPEVDPTGVEHPSSNIHEPVLVSEGNLIMYNGIFKEIVDAGVDAFYDFILDPELVETIVKIVEDFIAEGNVLSSLNSVLQAIAENANVSEFGTILQLIELGSNINDAERAGKVAVGDTVVEVVYINSSEASSLYIVFDSDKSLKNCYFE